MASMRTFDSDGRLHVDRSHISKATVNPYYGREIPGYDSLGLDPDKVYYLFRDPEELAKGAASFARLPILREHVAVDVDDTHSELIVGAIGSNVTFDAPYLDADLCFWEASAIAGIETREVIELSCAYRYDPVMEPGEFEGVAYDGRMTNIRGNHLALVAVGRAGSDILVADSKPKMGYVMKGKLGFVIHSALCGAFPALLAKSEMLKPLCDTVAAGDNAKLKRTLVAMDESMDVEQLDAIIDAVLGVEQDPKPMELEGAAGDESPEQKVRAMLAGKVEEDVINAICAMLPQAAMDEDKVDEKVERAMDELRTQYRDADEARRDVRQLVGDVVGMDKAADIYKFALEQMHVDHKGIVGDAALRALFKAVSSHSPTKAGLAVDSSPALKLSDRIPNLKRFGG